MAYYFFFSYKRVKNSEYQRAFFEDLCKEVSDQIEANENMPDVGFLDQSSIDPGEDWGQALANALQDSKVLVCAISPKYIESEYCGKEWQLFQMRREEYERRRKTQGVQNPPLPPFIKPVVWIPFPPETAPEVNKIQLHRGTKEDRANRLGIMQLIKLNRKTQLYKTYIIELARDIIAAAQFDLPPLPNLPLIGDVPSAFVQPQPNPLAPLQSQQQLSAPVGPGTPVRVKFIVVAGDPNTFAGQRQTDAYLPNGGPDWKPFHPAPSERIEDIIRRFDDNADVDYHINVAPLGNDLVSVTQEAYRNREHQGASWDSSEGWDPAEKSF
jgi:TIR domain